LNTSHALASPDATRQIRRPRRPRQPAQNCSAAVARLDGRTRIGRAVSELRAELVAHCAGKPSATQQALIELCCQLKARLAAMDVAFAESGKMTVHDCRTYLAWGNTLARTLARLGAEGTPARAPTLAELMAQPQGAAA